uniref:Uncharacterized protein n=1 Tax=Ursus maritimus TaxID=29073 RepID=A0A452UAQ5_URSMA
RSCIPGLCWGGGEQFSWSWRAGEGFQLLCRSCPCGSRPPGLAMDVVPRPLACPPAPPSPCRLA